MAQTKSKYYSKSYTANSIATYPEDTNFTGTMTSVAGREVIACSGTNTGFTNIRPGDWLVFKTTTSSEVIQIRDVDYTNKIIYLVTNVVNTHSGVPINVIQDKNAPYASAEYVTIYLKSGGTALYVNGNVVDPTDKQITKQTFDYVEPIVVEANIAFTISNSFE